MKTTLNGISRRQLLQAIGSTGLLATAGVSNATASMRDEKSAYPSSRSTSWDPAAIGAPLMRDPIWVYDNWAAYAEGVPEHEETRLTEALALKQLQQVRRLKRHGVRFDYYMMNAFWFDPDGGYRKWRQPDWPNGPDRWIAQCQESGLKPGLWFGSNSLWQINAAPEWKDSLAAERKEGYWFDSMSFYEGGFLADFMATLQHWYDRGIRMFEMDAANFDAATSAARKTQSPEEIRARNKEAFRSALQGFRRRNPDIMLVAFNGFGGDLRGTASPFPFNKPLDLRWLEVFDTLYSGDTRASDVPQANFWRSVDLYNDHMVRRFEQSGVPLERIDPFFTLSTTWFGFNRGKQAWRGMLLMSSARGSWKKTIYGSLELLSEADARWFAKVQQMYAPLMAMGRTKTFGGIPGETQPYGFGSIDTGGALYTVVNPTQGVRTVELPVLSAVQKPLQSGRILFSDAGFAPILHDKGLVLGPEQMAVVGFGRYSASEHDLGIQQDVVIPRKIERIEAEFEGVQANRIEATLEAPAQGGLRVLFQQRAVDGSAPRSKKWGKISARQGSREVLVASALASKEDVFGGISWSAGEIRHEAFVAGQPITIGYSVEADDELTLHGQVYVVEY